LEGTDHTHLGQLLTYAAGLNAVTIVWIAREFTEEHRATLDWLNEITDDRFNFFGLEIELWRIGDSPVAPKFNVVCKPNDWSKIITDAAKRIDRGELTEIKQLQLEYWESLRKTLLERKSVIKPQKPLPQHWTNFAIGRANFYLVAMVNTRDSLIGCGLICSGPDAKSHFNLLFRDKKVIEEEFGTPLEWRELPDKKESQVFLRQHDVDPTDRDRWPEQNLWLKEKLERFHLTFAHRVKQLDASDYEGIEPERN
jgi:hypothetical protein